MTRMSMKTINSLNEKDLKSKIQGTLRKESGKIKPLRHDIARMLTRLNEMRREK